MAHPTFPFPIPTQQGNQNLKNIPTVALPKFYSLITKDPETFLFDFDILCRSYDYTTNGHKLKLFPSTLKEAALRWFIRLGTNAVADWNAMRNLFLSKYKEYYRGLDLKGGDIFKMSQKEDETLEDYVSRFMFNLQRNTQHQLNKESQKHLFLKGVNDGSIEALDLMAGGDITQKKWTDIKNICLNYSRATMKKGRGLRDLPHKSNGGSGVSKMELSNLLSDFKQDIINNVAT